MRYKRLLLLATFAVLCPTAAAARQAPAQKTCSLTVEQSPTLRGFRLGMTLAQFKARAPGVGVREPVNGFTLVHLTAPRLNELDAKAYEGVTDIAAGFLDDRLVSLDVSYDEAVQWRDAAQFASRVGEMLKLPDAWRGEPGDYHREMTCDGFSVTVSPNRIRLTIPGTEATLRQRHEQREEERRRVFRP